MAILTKPSEIRKGFPADFEINKANLSGLAVVAQDAYFSDINNWNKISIVYGNDFGNSETVTFDATQISPTSKFDVSDKTRGEFSVQAILIYDFDGDYLLIPKVIIENTPELQADLAVVLTAPAVVTSYFISAWRNLGMVYSMSASYAVVA